MNHEHAGVDVVHQVHAPEMRDSGGQTIPHLHVRLLGGFRVERADGAQAVSDWRRRSAKALTKLVATCPGHALHREQILDTFWPRIAVDSALNSFGKALHAARRALEPELPRRQDSAYLQLADGMLVLITEHVEVDTDRFEQLAQAALRRPDIAAYEAALAAYGGELLPEDLYASWCAEQRSRLTELHVQLMLGVAEAFEESGVYEKSASRLREGLQQDPTREAAHRRLMHLYVKMGRPEQAIRQFQLCRDVLRRELDLAPQQETVSLYDDVLASRIPHQGSAPDLEGESADPRPLSPVEGDALVGGPFVGRERVVQRLSEQLIRCDEGRAGVIVVSGEAGVGKTRLLEEFATQASEQGALALWGGGGAHANQFTCGPFAVALEGYAASRPEADRRELARCYRALSRLVPSLGIAKDPPAMAADSHAYHVDFVSDIVRLLTDLARERPVLMVLGDLYGTDRTSLDLVRYLAHLAVRRPWLIVGAVRDDELAADLELRQMVENMTRARLCLGIDLQCLSRPSCHRFVQAMLPDVRVSDDQLEEIYLRSRGNPLFAGELIREIRRCDGISRSGAGRRDQPGGAEWVPAHARARMAMRLGTMDETLRRVLGLAAVSETEVSLSELRAGAAALEPPVAGAALFDALDRALQMRLLEECRTGYAFRHPLVRSAVFDCIPRHRRDEFHAAIAASRTPGHIREDDRKSAGIPADDAGATSWARVGRQTEVGEVRGPYQAELESDQGKAGI